MKGNIKLGVVLGALMVVAVLSISFVAVARNAGTTEAAKQTEGTKQTTLQVSNLSCGSCLYNIEAELTKLDGMFGMQGDLARGLVTVSHTEALVSGKIAAVITDLGYPARVLEGEVAGGKVADTGAYSGCRGCGPRGCGIAPPPAPPEKG